MRAINEPRRWSLCQKDVITTIHLLRPLTWCEQMDHQQEDPRPLGGRVFLLCPAQRIKPMKDFERLSSTFSVAMLVIFLLCFSISLLSQSIRTYMSVTDHWHHKYSTRHQCSCSLRPWLSLTWWLCHATAGLISLAHWPRDLQPLDGSQWDLVWTVIAAMEHGLLQLLWLPSLVYVSGSTFDCLIILILIPEIKTPPEFCPICVHGGILRGSMGRWSWERLSISGWLWCHKGTTWLYHQHFLWMAEASTSIHQQLPDHVHCRLAGCWSAVWGVMLANNI